MGHCYRVTTKIKYRMLKCSYWLFYIIQVFYLSMQCINLPYNVHSTYVLKLTFIEMWSLNTGGHYKTSSTLQLKTISHI